MAGDFSIRAAGPDEAGVLIEFRERMLRELDCTDQARLDELARRSLEWFGPAFAQGQAAGWLAEHGGRVLGAISMTLQHTQPQYRSLEGRVASIYGLFVEPAERGRGIATALVRAAVEHAREIGFEIVTLHAADKARPIYERLGFAPGSEMRLFIEASNRRASDEG